MLLIAIGLVAASPPAKTLTGKVVKIADGDTLTLLVDKTQIRVRLEGMFV
jgi:micrococcal nuclease